MDQAEEGKFVTPLIERRHYRRAKLVTQVKCDALGREDILLTRDVSLGGIFVVAKSPYPINHEVALSFRLKASDPAIECRCKVVYALDGVGMGLQFLDLSEETRTVVKKFVDEIL